MRRPAGDLRVHVENASNIADPSRTRTAIPFARNGAVQFGIPRRIIRQFPSAFADLLFDPKSPEPMMVRAAPTGPRIHGSYRLRENAKLSSPKFPLWPSRRCKSFVGIAIEPYGTVGS